MRMLSQYNQHIEKNNIKMKISLVQLINKLNVLLVVLCRCLSMLMTKYLLNR